MTIPYLCRLDLCATLGACDPLAPAHFCPLYPEVRQNFPGCVSNSDESPLVRANGHGDCNELDVNDVSVPLKDVCVSASRHEDLVP